MTRDLTRILIHSFFIGVIIGYGIMLLIILL